MNNIYLIRTSNSHIDLATKYIHFLHQAINIAQLHILFNSFNIIFNYSTRKWSWQWEQLYLIVYKSPALRFRWLCVYRRWSGGEKVVAVLYPLTSAEWVIRLSPTFWGLTARKRFSSSRLETGEPSATEKLLNKTLISEKNFKL